MVRPDLEGINLEQTPKNRKMISDHEVTGGVKTRIFERNLPF